MSTCNIKIYRTQLTPSRNALVDNLEGYLKTLIPNYSNASFQYQQLGLDLTIKVNVDQSKISESNIGNYVRIEQDNRIWYYFILGAKWKGKKVVQLALSIDSINTFRNDLHWTDKTTITRQHGDRFVQDSNLNFIRHIDDEGEGIAAEKFLSSRLTLQEHENLKWYLMYRTRDLSPTNYGEPIACYLFANKPLQIASGASGDVTLTKDTLIEGTYYYFNYIDNPGGSVNINGVSYTLGNTYKLKTTSESNWYDRTLQGIVITKYNGTLRYGFQWNDVTFSYTGIEVTTTSFHSFTAPGSRSSNSTSVFPKRSISSSIPLSYDSIDSVVITNGEKWRISQTMYTIAEQSLISQTFYYTVAGQPAKVINGLSTIDRTDSRIMKIIELPYAPCEVGYNSSTGNYTFPSEWTYDAGFLRLNDLDTEFLNHVGDAHLNEYYVEDLIPQHLTLPKDNRGLLRESKLFHSDFYTYKATYDSFSKEIKLEDIVLKERAAYDSDIAIPIYYKHTNTINSKSAFKLDFNELSNLDFGDYRSLEDYNDYLMIARNNEIPIYSNDYINYIRTGYNYDLKAQELAKEQALANIAGQVASTGIQIGTSYATSALRASAVAGREANKFLANAQDQLAKSDLQGYMLNAANKAAVKKADDIRKTTYSESVEVSNQYLFAQGVGSAAGIIPSIINLYYSQAQADNERNAKLSNLAAQSTSVAGSDDVDLLGWYNGNKLQLIKYDTKQYQKEAIADLFHYCGYTHAHMEYPDITSRLWFNFIQCEPFFREEPYTPFQQYLEDIKTRYATGVTVYHCNEGQWNWDQDYENWEVAIYPKLSYISNDSIQGFKAIPTDRGSYDVSFTYLGRQNLNGADLTNIILIEVEDMYGDVIYTRQVAANYGRHVSFTTDELDSPVVMRYKIEYEGKETEWQTIALAGG